MNWISVKERLPEKDTEVLVYLDGQSPCQCVAYYHKDKGWGSMDWYLTSDRSPRDWRDRITHWMPLPEPSIEPRFDEADHPDPEIPE